MAQKYNKNKTKTQENMQAVKSSGQKKNSTIRRISDGKMTRQVLVKLQQHE